jgi:quercetin dioxygenase-like cupin family protein
MDQSVMRSAGVASIARGPGEGAQLNVLGSRYVFKATSQETGGQYCCIDVTLPPGAGVPPHTHSVEDEAFYVTAGEVVFEAADQPRPLRLGAGSFFFGSRGRRHAFRNEGPLEARMLVICTPGAGLERMFIELDAAGASEPPAMDEVVAITARAGVAIEV